MKEDRRESKKGLLIGIIAGVVALAGLTVGGIFLFGGKGNPEPTEPVETGETAESTEPLTEPDEPEGNLAELLFWNVDRVLYAGRTEAGTSSRTADKDGYYHIQFSQNGRTVERRVMDKKLVNQIDGQDLMGLVFDDQGVITGIRKIEEFTGGYLYKGIYVNGVKEDGTIILNTAVSMDGMEIELDLPEGVTIYDVSGATNQVGSVIRPTDLLEGDRLHIIQDKEGNVIAVYLFSRYVKTVYYWNVRRMWDESIATTTRMPDENGVYTILMAAEGEQVEVKTKSRTVAEDIDRQITGVMSLKFDEEGYAVEYVDVYAVGSFGSWYHITELSGSKIVAHKYIDGGDQGATAEGVLAEGYECYDVSGVGDFIGQKYDDLKVYDQIHCIRNLKGEIACVYVVGRIVDSEIYWNMNREADAKTHTTLKKPDANGYYWFELAVNGTVKRFKTADKAVADEMDYAPAKCYGLKIENDEVTKFYPAANVTGGGPTASWYTVVEKQSATEYTTKKISQASDTGRVTKIKLAENCKIYNVSDNKIYDSHAGELMKELNVGDVIHGLTNLDGEVTYVMLITRAMGGAIYWNLDRQYDSKTQKTLRKPDENGDYVFKMATGGKQVTLKTKDERLASEVDSYVAFCMCIDVSGDRIVRVGPTAAKFKTSGGLAAPNGNIASWADVMSISGNQFRTQKTIGGSDQGKIAEFVMAADCEIYNVSSEAAMQGEKTTLRVGDRVHVLVNSEKQASIIFIVNRPGLKVKGTCPECGKEVTWTSFTGVYEDSAEVTNGAGQHVIHYFLESDRVLTEQSSTPKNIEIHFNLNSHVLTGADNCRTIALFDENSTLRIFDISDGKAGVVRSANGKGRGADSGSIEIGGVIWLRFGTDKLYVKDVTLDFSAMDQSETVGGIFLPAGAYLELDQVKVIGAKKALYGAAIYSAGTMVLKDTSVTGGTGVTGGLIEADGGSLTIDGSTVIKGCVLTDGTKANLMLRNGAKIATSGGITSAAQSIGVTAGSPGAFTANNFEAYKDVFTPDVSAEITVGADGELVIAYSLTGIQPAEDVMTVEQGSVKKIVVNPVPSSAELGPVTYESADPTKVSVDENGYLKGLELTGDDGVTVTVKGVGGVEATIKVIVTELSPDAHAHVIGTLPDIQAENGSKVVFEAFDADKLLANKGGVFYMYLTKDVDLNGALYIPDTTLVLCLNGHKIRSASSRVIQNNGTAKACEISICDCSSSGSGSLTGGSADQGGAIWTTTDNCPLSIYGGTFTNEAVSTNFAGGAVINAVVLNLYGGTVKDGRLNYGSAVSDYAYSYGGGNVTATTLNMYGGTIENGRLYIAADKSTTTSGSEQTVYGFGGNVYAATLNMSGGTIRGGKLELAEGLPKNKWCSGGNVFVTNLNMTGGTIENGVSDTFAGNVHISGTSTISGGEVKNGTAYQYGGNIALDQPSAVLTIRNAKITGGRTTASSGGNIRVNGTLVVEEGTVISDGEAATAGGSLWLERGVANINGGTLTGGNANFGGNIYTSSGVTLNLGSAEISSGQATRMGGNLFLEGGTVTMTGTSVKDGTAAESAGNIRVEVGDLTIYDGTVIENGSVPGSENEWKYGGNIAVTGNHSSSVTMHGGTIKGGATNFGANVYVCNAVYTLNGGSVEGGTANGMGGNFFLDNSATFVMAGGEVKGGVSSTGGGNFYLQSGSITTVSGGKIYGGSMTGGNGSIPNIYADGTSRLTVTGGSILAEEENAARNSIWIGRNSTVSIDNAKITRIWAQPGTAPFVKSGFFYTEPDPSFMASGVGANELETAESETAGGKTYSFRYEVIPAALIVTHKHCVCGAETLSAGGHSHETVGWTAWTVAGALPTVQDCVDTVQHDESGHYYFFLDNADSNGIVDLGTNIWYPYAADNTPANGKKIVLCLNGKTVRSTAHRTIRLLNNAGADLAITDCTDSGKIETVKTGNEGDQGAFLWLAGESGTVTIYNGTMDMSARTVNYGGNGAFVDVTGPCAFNMYGGTLIGGQYESNGAGVLLHLAGAQDSHIYGGTLIGGSSSSRPGGTIFLRAGAALTIHDDVVVKNGVSPFGGNIYTNGTATLTIRKATIMDGQASRMGGNIFMEGGTVTLSGTTVKNGTAAESAGNIRVETGTLNIGDGTLIEGGTVPASGAEWKYGGSIAVCGNHSSQVVMNGGTIKGGQTNYGGNLYLVNSMFTLNGGVIEGGTANGSGGNVFMDGGSTLNMNGGEIRNGVSSSVGGNLLVNSNTVANISGGLLYGGTMIGGDHSIPNVYVEANGALNVTGGILLSDESSNTSNSIWMSSAAVVSIENAKITRVWAQSGIQPFVKSGYFYEAPSNSYLVSGSTRSGMETPLKETIGDKVYTFGWEIKAN